MSNYGGKLNTINRRHEAVFGVVLASVLIIVAVITKPGQPALPQSAGVNQQYASAPAGQNVITAREYDDQLEKSRRVLIQSLEKPVAEAVTRVPGTLIDERKLLSWVREGHYSSAHHYLIESASAAVDSNDLDQLGQIMRILAQLSASQGDLASTEVYLYEALDIFRQLNSQDDLANINLLIGQMYASRRQIAQMAGWAYGDLLMARFYLSKGQHYRAKESLDASIHDNLKLGRTGAVASAYKTMARYYRAVNDISGERDAMIEAGKFYAHSGQAYQSQQVVRQLYQDQAPLNLIQSLERQIEINLARYESQITIQRQARDYMQLYSLYKSKGEYGRAWQFRVKASEILSRVDKRDMYYQMPDVMAVLYDSNFNLTKASRYYKKASDYYLSQNRQQAYQRAELLISNLN